MSRDHRKLRAFELADKLLFVIYDLSDHYPREELYVLASQMRKAALTVPSNIVEGCGRTSHAEYVNHLNIAQASLRELGYHISVAVRRGYINPDRSQEVDQLYEDTGKTLGALLRSLRNGD